MVHMYDRIVLSHQKEGNNATCSNMDGLETVIQSEVSQTERDKYHITSKNTCEMQKKKNGTNELIY